MNGLKSAVAGKAVRWMKFVDHIHNSMEDWWKKYKGELGENARFGGLEAGYMRLKFEALSLQKNK